MAKLRKQKDNNLPNIYGHLPLVCFNVSFCAFSEFMRKEQLGLTQMRLFHSRLLLEPYNISWTGKAQLVAWETSRAIRLLSASYVARRSLHILLWAFHTKAIEVEILQEADGKWVLNSSYRHRQPLVHVSGAHSGLLKRQKWIDRLYSLGRKIERSPSSSRSERRR